MVIHDDVGEFVYCCSLVHSGVLKVYEGRAWGVVEAVSWASSMGLNQVIVKSDSKRVVDALKSGNRGDTVLYD